MNVLVIGGAGYIGSHVALELCENGHSVAVFDNLSTGHKEAVLYGNLAVIDLEDKTRVKQIIKEFKPDAVMHFAASIEVAESVKKPIKYYRNNTANTINLLESLIENNIRYFIFSSTAAVYGNPIEVPIKESHPLNPINPYGQSKAFIEKILEDLTKAYNFNYIALRYFNVAGASPQNEIGESHNPETHLIPLILKTAKGEREKFYIYGADYPTPDGTAIRDFIHVIDLAEAHILALEYLLEGRNSDVFNVGYGRGFSVREVVNTAKKVTKKEFSIEETERRPGDPAVLVADNTKIKQILGWKPKYDDLEYIIKTAWNWELNRKF